MGSEIPLFSEIPNQIARGAKAWKEWFDQDEPENSPVPEGYDNTMDTWKKTLLMRSWCPDRTMAQAAKYISESMGARYAEAVILNMEDMWKESDKRNPLICFLSM